MPDDPVPVKDFEGLLKDLGATVERLERGNLPLEESIALYAKGVELMKAAQGVLDQAQARLEVLMTSADGSLVARPLDPAEFLEDK